MFLWKLNWLPRGVSIKASRQKILLSNGTVNDFRKKNNVGIGISCRLLSSYCSQKLKMEQTRQCIMDSAHGKKKSGVQCNPCSKIKNDEKQMFVLS